MAKTLLDGVNAILKRVKLIAGDAEVLSTLTDGSRQTAIDNAVQIINEGVDALYTASKKANPKEQAESTITLVAGTRSYNLAADLVQLRWPLIDKTNTQYLTEYPGGYNAILIADPEQNDTGLPIAGAISPIDGKLYLDRAPTSAEAGRIYTYQYDKDLELDSATDEFPFSNIVFRAMVPAWVQLWKREQRDQFDQGLFNLSIGRAAELLTQQQQRSSYNPRC